MNNSLAKFVNLRKTLLISGAVALFVALILVIGNQGSTTASTWTATDDTNSTTFETYDDCFAEFDNCIETPGEATPASAGQAIFAGYLFGLGSALLSLGTFAHFLILTSSSIVEGMGGNIQVPVKVKQEEKQPE